MKLQRMNLGLERAFSRMQALGNNSQKVRQSVIDTAQKVEAALLPFISKSNDIQENLNLTPVGMQADLKLQQGFLNGKLHTINPLLQIEVDETLANAEITNTVARAMGSLLSDINGFYDRPRCTFWHVKEHFTTHGEHVRTLGTPPMEFINTRCPHTDYWYDLGSGREIDQEDLEAGCIDPTDTQKPCQTEQGCEWFKIVPKV